VQSLIGRTIAGYHITGQIGSGGMGVVYRAQDATRTVAIKVLPAEKALDQRMLRRFSREAKASAALSHPNVAQILEVGETEGIRFIVMEYISGESLDRRMRAPLDISEVVQIGVQVAEALDAAHSKGIVHRDIKPGNVMITRENLVKVLDFGLAKLMEPSLVDPGGELGLTTQTETGMTIGTVFYMSPEQAIGAPVDYRSDIFSFGVLLYEMTTGRRPFTAKSLVETIEHILHSQPEAIALFNSQAGPGIERIIRKCMEKDPRQRYQSAHDLVHDLRTLKQSADAQPVEVPAHSAEKKSRRIRMLVGNALLLLLLLAIVLYVAKC